MIEIKNLCFSYAQHALFAMFSAQFKPGITWVKGANGCGKSTLLKLLAGIVQPNHGQITLQGIPLTPDAMDYRLRQFWCGPGPIAFDHLTPLEYLGFMQSLYPSFDAQALPAHVDGFSLTPHLQTPMRALSTGTQRKVWLTAALSAHTPVTLLDEPLNALDTASLRYLEAALADCAQQADRAWIIVSHEAFGVASDKAGVLILGDKLG
jgi:ABC-type multidrug transport system ATPase subunit